MKIVFWAVLCVLFGTVVFTAPVSEDVHQETGSLETDNSQSDYQRDRRLDSDYYAVSPCAAASSSNVPVASYAPDALYQSNVGPLQARYYASEYVHPDYAASWYRTVDPYRDNREMMRYSDTNFVEQTPMNNMYRSVPSSYMPVNTANTVNFNGQMPNPVGAAYGIFPNANVGDCNVPLLLSCSPSIVTGRIVNPDSSGFDNLSSTSGRPTYYGYRGVNGQYLHGMAPPKSHAEHTTNDHASPSSLVNSVQNNKVL